MTVGSSGGENTATIINGVNGKIIVEDRGVGIELGGIGGSNGSNQTKADATNYGTITVGAAKKFEDKNGQFTTGVAFKAILVRSSLPSRPSRTRARLMPSMMVMPKRLN